MRTVFIGSVPESGIGQVSKTLCNLVDGDYIIFGQQIDRVYDVCFCFIIPTPRTIELAKQYSTWCKKMVYMTVCETETVHPLYERLFELSDTFYVPSQFAADILKRQFPTGTFKVLKHYANPQKKLIKCDELNVIPSNAYVFYHIGNVIDFRKNIPGLINTFIKLNLPNTYLVLKATCIRPVNWSFPNGIIIEGLMPESKIEYIHNRCDCYVSCSYSEGVGMGAVEAAIRGKPVIIQEYGGTKEYVDTPYIIPSKGLRKVGAEDFLFQKDMLWGDPDMDVLAKHMLDVYTKQMRRQEHPKTHRIMKSIPRELNLALYQ